MSYIHIPNLFKDVRILDFKWVYALEKIHGSTAHLTFREVRCEKEPISTSISSMQTSTNAERGSTKFKDQFDSAFHLERFRRQGLYEAVVYGESYGGSHQGMADRYGAAAKFVAFDVKVTDAPGAPSRWLSVLAADGLATALGFEFVPYVKVPTDLAALDAERDRPSEQARRNGVPGEQAREGVVLRPPFEVVGEDGNRILAKHKRDEERETKTPRKVLDAAALLQLTEASEIAEEWVTPMRLTHVLEKLGPVTQADTGRVNEAMLEDVLREAVGEIPDTIEDCRPQVRVAIGQKTAALFRARFKVEK